MRAEKRPDSIFVEAHLHRVNLQRSSRPVLEDVSWIIRPGQRWILAGGNGAGKTQLLKLVAGIVWPTPQEGAAQRRFYRWRRQTWASPFEVKDEIGYLGPERQDKYARYEWNHTVEQIVATGVYRTDIALDEPSAADRKRIAAALRRLGIGAFANRPFLSLSYGERRLALLARALASRSKLLLLDELLNGLDELNRGRALRWLQHTKKSRLPWVLTTHRIEDVPDCVTHALVLEKGRVVYRGKVAGAPLRRWLNCKPADPCAAKLGVVARPGQVGGANGGARASSAEKSPAARGRGRLLLRLSNATVYLDAYPALRNISCAVHKGECWMVHGGNGSGKTTLLRTLYGDHGVAAGGRIERAGVAPGVPIQVFKTRVGLVAPHLQADHPRGLTVATVVQSGRHASIGLNAAASAADRAAATRSLAFFGLAELAARTLAELSYGQMRRVLFARAWVRRPQLLLLDEPYSGVDLPTRRDLQAHVEKLLTAGGAVIMASHHRSEWPGSTTHELQLEAGGVVYCGPVRGPALKNMHTLPAGRYGRKAKTGSHK